MYAFVSDGDVKYIGKTIRTLNNECGAISVLVQHSLRILIITDAYASYLRKAQQYKSWLVDNGHLRYGQFHLNLAAGLEDDLIRVLNPEWNGGLKEAVPLEDLTTVVEPLESEDALPQASFNLTLQKTYYTHGFFDVSVDYQSHFGADGETIEVALGTSSAPVLGTINRRANSNGTPRIIVGAALKSWFQQCFEPLDTVAVEILSPRSIRLRKTG